MADSEDIPEFPDYVAEKPQKYQKSRKELNGFWDKKAVLENEDRITLDNARPVFEKIEKAGLLHLGELCGGLSAELFRRIYLKETNPNYLSEVDSININSKDIDYRSETFFLRALEEVLLENYPELNPELKRYGENYEEGRFWFMDLKMFGDEEQEFVPITHDKLFIGKEGEETLVESFPSIKFVDDKDGLALDIKQGIPTIEKPFGEDGPSVRTIDPLSVMMAKANVLHSGDVAELTKQCKYHWHMRILALCIPYYLEDKTRQFKEGKLDRDPAIVARRLLNDTNRIDRGYYEAFGDNRKALDAFKRSLLPYAQTSKKEFYQSEDITQHGRNI